MQASLLLFRGPNDDDWQRMVVDALAPWGHVYVTRQSGITAALAARSYDFILMDALAVQDVLKTIRVLHLHAPKARIIVMTSSPTWQRARDAIKAGATDYVRKTFVKADLLAELMPFFENHPETT